MMLLEFRTKPTSLIILVVLLHLCEGFILGVLLRNDSMHTEYTS